VNKKIGKKKKKKKKRFSYTLHLIINRTELRTAVDNFTYYFGFIFGGAFLIGLLFSAITLLIFNSTINSLKYHNKIIYHSTPEMEERIDEEIKTEDSIFQKLLPQIPGNYYKNKLQDIKAEEEIKDAILYENE
jgi:hypothetical protein